MDKGLHLQEGSRGHLWGLLLVRRQVLLPSRDDCRCRPARTNAWPASFCCCRYINALEAPSANFARNFKREMIRDEGSLLNVLSTTNRHSNSQYIGIILSLFFFFSLNRKYGVKGANIPALRSSLTLLKRAEIQVFWLHPVENKNDVFISVFILCGGPNDVVSVKSKATGPITEETLFILLDVYKWATHMFFFFFFVSLLE